MASTDNTALWSSTSESVTNASCSTYEGGIYFAVKATSLLSNLVSFLVSCTGLFFIILFKRWHFFNQRLVLYLSLATIIVNVTTMLSGIDHEDGICAFGGFVSQIGAWVSVNAYVCITATLLLKIFFTTNLEKLDIPIILFIFASPFLFNWIPFIKHSYGKSGPFCWIRNVHEVDGVCELYVFGQTLQLVLWYIPLYIILSIMIIVYIVIVVKFCFHRKQWVKFDQDVDSQRKQALKYTVSLLAYPVIYFLINIFPFINRIFGLFNPTTPSPALWFLSGITYPQQGTGVAIVILLSVRKKLNIANIKAAANEWCQKTQIKEYAINDNELETTISYEDFDKTLSTSTKSS